MKHISALHSRYITFCFARENCLKYQIQRTESGSLGLYSFNHILDSETDRLRDLLTDYILHLLRMTKGCCQAGHALFFTYSSWRI